MNRKELKAHLRTLVDEFYSFKEGKTGFGELLEIIIDELEKIGVFKEQSK